MTPNTTTLATRKTVVELVREWNLAMHCLEHGLDAIKRAEQHLKAFDTSGTVYDLHAFRHDEHGLDFDRKRARMKRAAWRYLTHRIELKKLASIKRGKEIDKQLHDDGSDLPEITVENIFGWLESMDTQAREFMQEAVVEVYQALRPYGHKHKTNSSFRVGRKVILCHRVGPCYSGRRRFRVNYHYSDELRALDNVFHMLAGQGLSEYQSGDLATAIEQAEGGVGETEFFRFRCFRNNNLHIEFRRMDLVEQLNSIGGNGLPDPDRD